MLRPDGDLGVVETGEIAGADVHRADAQADLAGVDAVEIDQGFHAPFSAAVS
jgi:hypothetical protein